jgi:hypothetical protein
MPTQCFMVHPVARERRWLRRFTFSGYGRDCPGSRWGHDGEALLDEIDSPVPSPRECEPESDWRKVVTKDDPRWPQTCVRCDYRFADDDQWQLFSWRVYADAQGRTFITHPKWAVPGMMWWSEWLHHSGRCMYWDDCTTPHLYVVLPGGHEWDVMSRASNCTMPNDRLHRCWVLEGAEPNFSVGKSGRTCGAGAGSIMAGGYHGFLRNGMLT